MAVAEELAERIQGLHGDPPAAVREICERLLVDVAGLCLVARRRHHVKAAVASTLRLEVHELVDALGISGSMSSGIIEYLAEGTWTKRMHPGWAAQSGLRAALLGRAGFRGPRTVFEGTHGLFHGFAHTREGDYAALLDGFGERWVTTALAFKPYPCGTMIQPYIDCARRLRERVSPGD